MNKTIIIGFFLLFSVLNVHVAKISSTNQQIDPVINGTWYFDANPSFYNIFCISNIYPVCSDGIAR